MKKILITGFSGFVSRHLLDFLNSREAKYQIIGVIRNDSFLDLNYQFLNISTYQIDLKNYSLVLELITRVKPNYILHLASESSVSFSWKNPVESFYNNTNIFLNIVESIRVSGIQCRLLSVGSSEEYGIVKSDSLPLIESQELNPISPYAVARVSQEMLSKVYSKGYGLDIVMTRSFNHIGPGQKEYFVISSFAKQIVNRIKCDSDIPIQVGDVSITRDFLDVRDVVKAYMLLLENGESGQIYNVCSGYGNTLENLLIQLIDLAGVKISYLVKEELIRPSDNPIIIGSNEKLKGATCWEQEIELKKSLYDILNYWKIIG